MKEDTWYHSVPGTETLCTTLEKNPQLFFYFCLKTYYTTT